MRRPGGEVRHVTGHGEARSGRAASPTAGPRGYVFLGDKDFAGQEFESLPARGARCPLIGPDRKDEPARFGKLARVRQWIESVIDPRSAAH
jgi:hypothetical protein